VWAEDNGNNIDDSEPGPRDPGVLKKLYEDETFVESLDLDHIGDVLS